MKNEEAIQCAYPKCRGVAQVIRHGTGICWKHTAEKYSQQVKALIVSSWSY